MTRLVLMAAGLLLAAQLAVTVAAGAPGGSTPLPAGGGEPGQAYREFLRAGAAKDWKGLHRVTSPRLFARVTQLELPIMAAPPPTNAELILSGTRQGTRAVLEVEVRLRVSAGETRSSTTAVALLLDGGQWKVAMDDTDPAGPALPFEPAETLRRIKELGFALESYRAEHGSFPAAKDAAALAKALPAKFLPTPYAADGWGRPLAYRLHPSGQGFLLISFGADGAPEAGRYDASGVPLSFEPEATTDPGADIVVRSGPVVLRYPRGAHVD